MSAISADLRRDPVVFSARELMPLIKGRLRSGGFGVGAWRRRPGHGRRCIDNAPGDVKPSQVVKVADPRPAQLLVEFDTADKPNARATKIVTPMIAQDAKETGVIVSTSDTPVAGGARLTVIVVDTRRKTPPARASCPDSPSAWRARWCMMIMM